MKKVRAILILLVWCILMSGTYLTIYGNGFCTVSKELKVGDELYIPKGYKNELDKMKLTEIAPMPYFTSPFITVEKDSIGNQYAVIFREDGKVDEVILPETYENIVVIYEAKGFKVEKYAQEFSNLHLFEINGKLYWNYSSKGEDVFLDLYGKEEYPLKQDNY